MALGSKNCENGCPSGPDGQTVGAVTASKEPKPTVPLTKKKVVRPPANVPMVASLPLTLRHVTSPPPPKSPKGVVAAQPAVPRAFSPKGPLCASKLKVIWNAGGPGSEKLAEPVTE